MLIFDSHCHLDYIQTLTQHDTPALVPGITLEDNLKLTRLRHNYPVYKIGFGIHPWFISQGLELNSIMSRLEEDINQFRPDCIGEIGLDYFKPNIDLQKVIFIRQLELALKYNLPVIIHGVKAYSDILGIVKRLKITCGIIHGFNGNKIIADEFIQLGFLLGVGSLISQNSRIKRAIHDIPLQNLVLESDAPFMPLLGKNTSLSSDTFLYAQLAAKQININLIDLINHSNTNFLKLFRN